MKKLLTIAFGGLVFMSVNPVYAEVTPEEVTQNMAKILYEIEQAAGDNHKVSQRVSEFDEQSQQILYESVPNKERFVNSIEKSLQRIEAVKRTSANYIYPPVEATKKPSEQPPETPLEVPFSPVQYPSTDTRAYIVASGLGLTSSNQERCGGAGLENYKDILYLAQKASDAADILCTTAGCDPIGIACAGVCATAGVLKAALLIAKVPIEACDRHGSSVDAAEIQASYKNSESVLRNQKIIVDNQKYIK